MLIRMMVVDDDPFLIDLFEAAQSTYGFTVVGTAFDGKEALEVYPRISPRPDVVIMDQRMPNMCGVECTKNLLRMDPQAKVVFVSGEPMIESVALSVGAAAFIAKPFAMHDLMKILERLMSDGQPSPKTDPPTRMRVLKSTSGDSGETRRDQDADPPER